MDLQEENPQRSNSGWTPSYSAGRSRSPAVPDPRQDRGRTGAGDKTRERAQPIGGPNRFSADQRLDGGSEDFHRRPADHVDHYRQFGPRDEPEAGADR